MLASCVCGVAASLQRWGAVVVGVHSRFRTRGEGPRSVRVSRARVWMVAGCVSFWAQTSASEEVFVSGRASDRPDAEQLLRIAEGGGSDLAGRGESP